MTVVRTEGVPRLGGTGWEVPEVGRGCFGLWGEGRAGIRGGRARWRTPRVDPMKGMLVRARTVREDEAKDMLV